MKLSSKTHYGLLACNILGRAYPKGQISATTLESYVGVSCKYIEQIMRKLGARGIVSASRGAQGGYYLLKSPSEITIGEIVRALEDDIEIIECVGKDAKCKCCPSSGVWKKLYSGINELLDSMNLQQMIDGDLK